MWTLLLAEYAKLRGAVQWVKRLFLPDDFMQSFW
jgi:hypothetical protein